MTASEQRLGAAFAAIIVLGGAYLGVTKLKAWKLRVDQRAITVNARALEAQELMAQKDFWQQRSAWLQEKQPIYTKRDEADLALLKLIQDSAAQHEVKINQNQPMEPLEALGLTSATMTVVGQGDMAKVMQWLHKLQEPSAFITISALNMVPNEENTAEVILTMSLQKWYRHPPPA